MWAVYVSEAEKYDRSLVESWRSDMEGMLIFAGLFSAGLTAFLTESYKTLVPDSGDSTASILAQISLQLSASANGTTYHVPPPMPFTPTTSSLICNVLWFLSLGLSPTCALIATLLEQWARDFLHRADMRSAPVIRARVFSFLYYGLKRFRMHTVVEIIPLLLHASLLLFFAGPTPLSSGFWRLRQNLRSTLNRWRSRAPACDEDNSMVESVFCKAMESSDERSIRDRDALAWTVKSLADDNELESFIEAIPPIIWAPHRTSNVHMFQPAPVPVLNRRYVYDDHICLATP
ncbi:hypothetical protein DFH06DRAFT_1213273, partial [Mycena polygramma]